MDSGINVNILQIPSFKNYANYKQTKTHPSFQFG